MTKDAVLLTGPLGLGHEMMARCCEDLLAQAGWRTRRPDSMSLLGRQCGGVGDRLFHRLVGMPGPYDGLHFAYLRTVLARQPADLLISVFATGAAAAARLKAEAPDRRAVALAPGLVRPSR